MFQKLHFSKSLHPGVHLTFMSGLVPSTPDTLTETRKHTEPTNKTKGAHEEMFQRCKANSRNEKHKRIFLIN